MIQRSKVERVARVRTGRQGTDRRHKQQHNVKLEVFTEVCIQVLVFWVTRLHTLICGYKYYGAMCYLHLTHKC